MKKILTLFVVGGLLMMTIYLVADFSGSSSIEKSAESSYYQHNAIINDNKNNKQDIELGVFDMNSCLDAQFVSQAMQSEPEETLLQIDSFSNNKEKERCYQIVFLAWSDIDFNSVYNKVSLLDPHVNLDLAISSLVDKYKTNIAYSISFAKKLFDEKVKDQTLTQLLVVWATEAPEKALSWSMKQSEESSIRWIGLVVNTVSLADIGSGIALLTVLKDAPLDQIKAGVQAVINNFDPALINPRVLSVIANIESERLKGEVIVALLPLMIASENISLSDLDYLIASLPPGEVRDELYQKLAANWVLTNPEEAASYAQSLVGDIRELAISAVISTWMHEDLNATSEWLKTLNGNIDQAAETLGRGASKIGNIAISDEWVDVITDDERRTATAIDIVQARYKVDPGVGLYHLVYQKNISNEEKLRILHELYPGEVFISPGQALDQFGRLREKSIGTPDTQTEQNIESGEPILENWDGI